MLGATSAGCVEFRKLHAMSRRRWLQVGGLGVFGLGLPQLLAGAQASVSVNQDPLKPGNPLQPGFGRARSCILLFMWGGPSQLDTWDPKPDAISEVRGEFQPIATSVAGTHISEHFPLLARQAHHYAIARSMTHGDVAHLSSVHHLMTGHHAPRWPSDADPPSRRDTPHLGSVLALLRPTPTTIPPFVTLPWIVSHPAAPGGKAPGQNAGWLGTSYDPLLVTGDPAAANFGVADTLGPGADQTQERLRARRSLLEQLDGSTAPGTVWHTRALDLISSPAAQRAFNLSHEPVAVCDRYGRNTHGQSVLLARRLIEAGVRLVCVNWPNDGQFWDTHQNNFNSLRTRLMPPADQAFAALLEDLHQRGLLEETLVVWGGEFGRTPRIAPPAGREHWASCYSAVLAGGGIRGGLIHGRSDRNAAYPVDNPMAPHDLTATVYHALGIAPDITLRDREGRPHLLTEGKPVEALFG